MIDFPALTLAIAVFLIYTGILVYVFDYFQMRYLVAIEGVTTLGCIVGSVLMCLVGGTLVLATYYGCKGL